MTGNLTHQANQAMATDMTLALREFARKKLSEAKQKGATLATATAATLSSSVVAAPTPFVFRSLSTQQSEPPLVERRRASLDRKLETLRTCASVYVALGCVKQQALNLYGEWVTGMVGKQTARTTCYTSRSRAAPPLPDRPTASMAPCTRWSSLMSRLRSRSRTSKCVWLWVQWRL